MSDKVPLSSASADKPPIRLDAAEAALLSDLALSLEDRSPVAELLLDEIERAEICAALPDDIVRIGSEVEFVNEGTGRAHKVRLVLPFEADIAVGAISVLTHAGAGLIGLRAGQRIDWPDAGGVERTLRVTAVAPRS